MNHKARNRLNSKMIARSLLALAVLIVPPQVFANHLQCPDGTITDSDGDALPDCWETDGIDIDDDGITDLVLYDMNQNGIIDPGEGADPNHKDIYIEADWMAEHQPNPAAIDLVVNSFANAPVNNPDGTQGIRLHILADEQASAHNNSLAFTPSTAPAGLNTPDFDNIKTNWFGTVQEWNDSNRPNNSVPSVWRSTMCFLPITCKGLGRHLALPKRRAMILSCRWAVGHKSTATV